MAIAYFGIFPCKVRESLSNSELLAKIKACNSAADCGFNQSMQRLDGIVQPVYRLVESARDHGDSRGDRNEWAAPAFRAAKREPARSRDGAKNLAHAHARIVCSADCGRGCWFVGCSRFPATSRTICGLISLIYPREKKARRTGARRAK
ncbi:hypothetical protein [Burkholderia pyrrocinia]|uniref:hypothetical protein n=1 Tax=Burkholderia pyrrocinia TaxID=60550 RepID=UPI00158E335E|nr:hypothetical protein [Burkholderia pyrrocinia]